MKRLRLAIDTGGTFTDLIVEDQVGRLSFFKSPTTPHDPIIGVINALRLAAVDHKMELRTFLGHCSSLLNGTTRALNAVLSNKTARTAFLTTKGHPDILLYREGGRSDPFNFTREFPKPYVPRSLTWEIDERVGSAGEIVKPLSVKQLVAVAAEMRSSDVEAVAVCLLWSPINPDHERQVGTILARELPGIPVTLSHELAPMLREYRRGSATAIDASLKPLMSDYIGRLGETLRLEGFHGRLLVVTSSGGVMDAAAVSQAPILAINSGPSMAPVAGRHFAHRHTGLTNAVVADTGGTSYDVSLVRQGHIPRTRESWLGPRYYGHMTGFPSVDISSIGAGGGSIAWVDAGGLLRIGPESAGADPGPACYARGGVRPTVTDACVVLGYIDPQYFLGGKMALDADAARQAVQDHVGRLIGLSTDEAATAVLDLATEHMVHAIEDVTVGHGVDPASAVLVAGGGAAGLNSVKIAARLGMMSVLFPVTGAVLSASGALLADLTASYTAPVVTRSASFDRDAVNACLANLRRQCEAFSAGPGSAAVQTKIEYSVEARYERQVWELEISLPFDQFNCDDDLNELVRRFHVEHESVFAVADPDADLEMLTWNARVSCRLHEQEAVKVEASSSSLADRPGVRMVAFGQNGRLPTPVWRVESLRVDDEVVGPAILESAFTTIIVDPQARARKLADGSIMVNVQKEDCSGSDTARA